MKYDAVNDSMPIKVQTIGTTGDQICLPFPHVSLFTDGTPDDVAPRSLQIPSVYKERISWEYINVWLTPEERAKGWGIKPWNLPPNVLRLAIVKDYGRLKVILMHPVDKVLRVGWVNLPTLLAKGFNEFYGVVKGLLHSLGLDEPNYILQQVAYMSPTIQYLYKWFREQLAVLNPIGLEFVNTGKISKEAFEAWKGMELGDSSTDFYSWLSQLSADLEAVSSWESDGGDLDNSASMASLGNNVTSALHSAIPGMQGIKASCPVPTCSRDKYKNTALSNIIIHLNDNHVWRREQIADWLEEQDWITELVFVAPDAGKEE